MNTRLVEHPNRKAAPDVPNRVKAAAEILATTPGAPDYAAIAKTVGYTNARALRRALSLPQSIGYLRAHKKQIVEEICQHNPERLRRIADADGGNAMAKVAAVRGLELMQREMDEPSYANRATPPVAGITIVMTLPDGSQKPLSPPAPEPPLIEHEPNPHNWPSIE
jgi:hypothetical protein